MPSRKLTLKTPVSQLFMVGPVYVKRLKKLGIERVEGLYYHFPHRYEDYSIISKINRVQPGEKVTIKGKIQSIKNQYTKRGKRLQKAIIEDETGSIGVTWFNQPFLVRALKKGTRVSLSGKAGWFGRKIVFISPEYEIIRSPMTLHTGRLVPVYPETYGVSSKWLRSRIAPLLSKYSHLIKDWLPEKIKEKYNLQGLKEAINTIHFPENKSAASQAKERLAFEEMFLIHLASLSRKRDWQKKSLAYQLFIDQEKILEFISSLPFKLTKAQQRCVKEILTDLSRSQPMNRLLEGDVGSGKTVVATIAMHAVFLNGFQSALMAPTEILAFQHYQTIKTLLESYGVKTELLTGSRKSSKLKAQGSKFDILIGTHALIHKHAKFKNLGLVVIDEQHRFGVEQRAQLVKKGKAPHILTMTATPIPRTVALTLYGDLDLSVIDEMPPGKVRVKTWVVPPRKREAGYDWIRKQVEEKKVQAFIICPLIEESEKESMKDIKAATAEYERLKEVFPSLKLGLLHGRLKSKEKEKVIEEFRNDALDVLVSTSVVEVGIDIPKATIMMIEGADRFGLAQLHQLRGRVGRRNLPSYCFLFTESHSPKIHKRLGYLEKTNIGMKLAEYDLRLRGPGELLGTKQHGFPDLRAASFTDETLIRKTRKAAEAAIDNLNRLPGLKKKLKSYTIKITYASSS